MSAIEQCLHSKTYFFNTFHLLLVTLAAAVKSFEQLSGKHSNFLPSAAAEVKCSCRKMAGHLFGYWVAFDKVIKLHQKRLVPEKLFYVALVVVDSCAIGPYALFALWSSCRHHHLLLRDQWRVICLIRLGFGKHIDEVV